VAEHTEVQDELTNLQDQVQTLRGNTQRTVERMGETQASLGHTLQRMVDLVGDLEDRIHDVEAEISEAHEDARSLHRRATLGHKAAQRELAATEPRADAVVQPPATPSAEDSKPAGASNAGRAMGEQQEIREQMAQTLAELHRLLGELKGTLPSSEKS